MQNVHVPELSHIKAPGSRQVTISYLDQFIPNLMLFNMKQRQMFCQVKKISVTSCMLKLFLHEVHEKSAQCWLQDNRTH